MLKERKIAVFFDCENVSSKYIDDVFDSLSSYGDVMIARAYCDWSNSDNKAWNDSLDKYALEAIHVRPNTAYKNAADIKLVIDVMNTMCTSKVDIIAIVSSDSDFTALAIAVKANNIDVIGFGEQKTPTSLCNACSVFTQLSSKPSVERSSEKPIQEITKIICEHQDEDGYVKVSQIGIFLGHEKSIGPSRNYGAKTWGDYIKMHPEAFLVKSVGRRKSTLMVKSAA